MDWELPDNNGALGEYSGILAVDVHGFSKHNDVQQNTIAALLPTVLQQAADRASLDELWNGRRFRAPRGDGYFLGFRPDLAGAVVDRYFDALQSELRRRSGEFRASGVELRLRASLHLGPLQSFDELVTDSPVGGDMVTTSRMVDADAVRALLDRSAPDVTFVASVVSSTVMDAVIAAGLSSRRPTEFVEAPLHVEAKNYTATGYLRVPAPSGELLTAGLLVDRPGATAEAQAASVSNRSDGDGETIVQSRDVNGSIRDRSTDVHGRVAVNGRHNVTAGRDVIDQSSGKQEFSGTFRTAGDSNYGASSGRRIGVNGDETGR
ncbi:hypothetical protein [Saccharopolyspora cebuensis]|uniref:hypothetical protein n=1 Tax=Saccharopolyspora cebuensis TaxID=418759 RepID=UPI0031F18F94